MVPLHHIVISHAPFAGTPKIFSGIRADLIVMIIAAATEKQLNGLVGRTHRISESSVSPTNPNKRSPM